MPNKALSVPEKHPGRLGFDVLGGQYCTQKSPKNALGFPKISPKSLYFDEKQALIW